MANSHKFNGNKTVRSWKELLGIVESLEEDFAEHIAKLAKIKMEDVINEKVYLENALGNETGAFYDRTGDLLEAITISRNVNGWEVKIDGRKIQPIKRTSTDMWGQHTSIHGVAHSVDIGAWIDEGNESPIYSYEGIHYVEEVKNYIDDIIQNEWIMFARKRGFNVK